MHVDINELAEALEVNRSTLWRWCKEGGLHLRTTVRRQEVPLRALLNYLHKTKRLPFTHVEKLAFEETNVQQKQ